MSSLYNVSIINKCDLWLREDEENPASWLVMSREQLEQRLQRALRRNEESKGRDILEYDDIVWKKFI